MESDDVLFGLANNYKSIPGSSSCVCGEGFGNQKIGFGGDLQIHRRGFHDFDRTADLLDEVGVIGRDGAFAGRALVRGCQWAAMCGVAARLARICVCP